jgi:glutamate/tyrosine decarboxylase-like PLP-dependent enzyme
MFSDKLKQISSLFLDFVDSEASQPALPYKTPEEVAAVVDLALREKGLSEDEVFALLGQVGEQTTKTSGNRFFNQLFGGRIDVATVADMLVSLMNTSMYTYKAASINILVEQEVIDRMCGFVGFSSGEGIFTPGGSISNMMQ